MDKGISSDTSKQTRKRMQESLLTPVKIQRKSEMDKGKSPYTSEQTRKRTKESLLTPVKNCQEAICRVRGFH